MPVSTLILTPAHPNTIINEIKDSNRRLFLLGQISALCILVDILFTPNDLKINVKPRETPKV